MSLMPDNMNMPPDNESRASREDLKEKMAILGRLTATIAHDVRNPLGTINTSIFAIKTAIEKNQTERLERSLKLAERNIKKCDQILAGFIAVTQKVEINTIPVNIDAWIKGFLEEQTLTPSIECIQDFNCDHAVSIDPDTLRQALSAILKNALQAMRDDSEGKLTVQTSMTEEGLMISVSDTGTGIPDDVFPRIFEPLFSTRQFGVGLGLTVAREIVEKHKGTIKIESKTGSGTKVSLRIPTFPVE